MILESSIESIYQKIIKIVNLNDNYFSFYDKSTMIDDVLHYHKLCRETIKDKVFTYECRDKCRFVVVVNYKEKKIDISELICE
jgi:hypothetical protein